MHYFVTLFPVPDGADPWATWEVIDERMDKAYSGDGPPPPTEAERAEMLEMAKTLRSWRPTLAEDGAMGSSFDLQDRELEVDLNIYADRTINVALPYVQDRGRDMMEFVMGCLEKLNKNDVYCAYDSELDRLVKRSDLSAMLERYRDLPEITAQRKARREAAKAAKKKEEKKPWWKVW